MCQKKICWENEDPHIVLNNFFKRSCRLYEIMWKNTVEQGRPQMAIWRMRIACCITMATHTHTPSQNAMLIAFLHQQLLHEHTSTLRYTYIACLLNALLYLYVTVRLSLHTLWRNRSKWRYSVLIYGPCTRRRWEVTFKPQEIRCVGSRIGLDK